MKVTKTLGWSLGTAGLCVAVWAGSWFGLVDPARAAAAEARESTLAAESANEQLEIRILQLKREFADLPARQAELAAIRLALPEDVAHATLLRQLQEQTADAGVTLVSVTSEAPVAVVEPAAAPVALPDAPADGGASATPSAEASAAPTDGGTVPDPAAAPVVDPATQAVLAAIPVVITTTGDYSTTTLALKNIQARMPRALLIDSLGLAPTSQGSTAEGDATVNDEGLITTTISGRVFAFVDPTAVDIAGLDGAALPPVPLPASSTDPTTAPSDG